MALSQISGTTGIADTTITSAKLADFSAAVDLNGVELLLDADQDTSITADTDDVIDFKIAGVEHISLSNSSGDTIIKPRVDAKDIIFQQFDGNKIFEINDSNFVGVGGNSTAAGAIRIYEDTDNGTHYSGFTVGNLTESVTYQLPNADGTSGQALVTNGSGVLTFSAVAANTPSSADGQALGSASLEWSDLFLADASTIQFGADQDVILTHVADTGLLLSGTNVIQFNDASQNIGAPTNAILDINATDEIELNATLVDVNANLDVSGTITSGGVITGTAFTAGSAVLAEAELELLDGLTAGTAIASKVVTTDASIDTTGQRNLTISGELDAATLDISGAIDIAGASQFSSTITVGANDQGYDIIIYGDTASANLTWDTSVDDLIFNGAARAVIPDGQLVLGSTAVTSTAAELNLLDGVSGLVQADLTKLAAVDSTATELNIIDGGATVGTTAFADGDGIVTNDNGTMRQTSATTLKTYVSDLTLTTAAQGNVTSLGTLTALTVDDVAVDGKVITMTGSSGDTFVTTVAANGATSLVTTDASAAAANLSITADGTLTNTATTITLDSAGDIVLDADDADIIFKDGGTTIMTMTNSSTDFVMTVATQDKDFVIKGDDGGSPITPFTLDMSAGGDLFLTGGLIDLKNDGSAVSQIKFYCESSNAHAQTLIGAPHSESATNTLTLPSTGGNSYLLTAASTATLTNKTINASQLVDNSVVEANMAANSIDSDSYVDGSIDTAHIADGQITTAKLATAVFTGATDIGAAIADADLFLMDDGAGGTIRKTAASRIKTYAGSPAGTLGFGAYRASSNFSISATTQTEIVFNSEYYDPSGKYDYGTGRFTPGVAGDYFIACSVAFDPGANMSNADVAYLKLRKNGTGLEQGQIFFTGSDEDQKLALSTSSIFTLDDDDYVSAWWYSQEAGVLLSVSAWLHGFRIA